MKISLLSNHYYRSLRRAGFHFLADALHAAGHEVTFITTGLSWISYARRDYRCSYPGIREAHGRLCEERPGFFSYVHFTMWHPHTLIIPPLDYMSSRFVYRYDRFSMGEVEEKIASSDIIIYESCNALFLVQKCRKLAPEARHVYRVSDDVRVLRSAHPELQIVEKKESQAFDLISVPCAYLAEKFSQSCNVRLHPHGVNTMLFDAVDHSPYPGGVNAVFVGNAYLDYEFIKKASEACPEIMFHLIGPFREDLQRDNVLYHGEMAFEDTVPYVKFADVGLYCLDLSCSSHSKSFTDSLKLKQYRYCGLPVVAPIGLDLHREGIFYYDASRSDSYRAALTDALQCGRDPTRADEVSGWDAVAADILSDL